jgi:hypothetical protein
MSDRGWQPADTDNFRDLGGRPTFDGGRVRRVLVFRSDTLQEISPADADILVEELERTGPVSWPGSLTNSSAGISRCRACSAISAYPTGRSAGSPTV